MEEETILNDVKSDIGIDSLVTAFDKDLITDINAAFIILYQEGVGPQDAPFKVESDTVWSKFSDDQGLTELTKVFIRKKVKSIFDPPQNTNLMQADNSITKEAEWRLNFEYELNQKEGG